MLLHFPAGRDVLQFESLRGISTERWIKHRSDPPFSPKANPIDSVLLQLFDDSVFNELRCKCSKPAEEWDGDI